MTIYSYISKTRHHTLQIRHNTTTYVITHSKNVTKFKLYLGTTTHINELHEEIKGKHILEMLAGFQDTRDQGVHIKLTLPTDECQNLKTKCSGKRMYCT